MSLISVSTLMELKLGNIDDDYGHDLRQKKCRTGNIVIFHMQKSGSYSYGILLILS